MTKFNPENKETLTYGECLDPAMKITDRDDAVQYLCDYVSFIQKQLAAEGKKDNPIRIAKQNLGYWAGYYSNETRERVEELFDCSHPVFGAIKEKGAPTAQEAFDMGKQLAQQRTRRKTERGK